MVRLRGNPRLCSAFWSQSLAGGDRGRPHGDGPTAAPSGAGVPDLRGRSRVPERARHGGAEIPRQTGRQQSDRLQVSRHV